VHQVTEGEGGLQAAIDAAADGDIIELVSDGGVYSEANPLNIDKSLTFRASDLLMNKPIIRGTNSEDAVFKVTGSDAKLELENLDIDGTDGAGNTTAKYGVRLDNGDVNGSVILKVMDCVLHDFPEKIIKSYPDCGIDSLIVDNSILYGGAKEGITLYSGTSSDAPAIIAYASFTNSTFYGFVREAIKGQTYDQTKVVIDRNTFYDIGSEGKSMIYFRNMTDVEVKNSIFVKNQHTDTDKFADFASEASMFHHNSVWDVVNFEVAKATVSDTVHLNPDFADPENGDFTLPETSPLLAFADDGGGIGDPRWNPSAGLPKVIKVEAGDGGLQAAIDAASDGDTIELVTGGGIYTEVNPLKIDKSLIFMASAALANKPIIRGTDSENAIFQVVGSDSKLQLENLDIDGTDGAGTTTAKYGVRLDNGDVNGTVVLKVLNCVMHDFPEKHIKAYPDCGIDSLIVDNSIFDGGEKEGITLYSGSSSDAPAIIAYASFTNSTFTNFAREAIKGQTYDQTKVMLDRNTFYNVGYDKKSMIYFRNMEDVQVKNSIFVKNQHTDTDKFADFASDVSLFHHNAVWDVVNFEVGKATVSDTVHLDPQFADPENGDFTLPETSPLLIFADDGGAIGDPRWVIESGKVFLTVVSQGQGAVALDPPGGVYDPGTSVTMTATPSSGWAFVGWSENVTVFPPNNPVATVTVNENMQVTAIFESLVEKYTLTVDTYGLGDVTADPQPNDNGQYEDGTEVTLTAVPGDNWAFEKWTGHVMQADMMTNPVVVKVDSNMSVTATFMSLIPRFTLDVAVVGEGSVSLDPAPYLGKFDTLSVVSLTAAPVPGWAFTGWSGDLESMNNPDSILMDADKMVTATFEEIMFETRSMEIDTTWDLRDAVEFANNNSYIDSLILITSGGLYTSTQTSDVAVMKPLTIVAKEGLEKKPIVTNSDEEKANDDIFRVFDDFTLVGVVLDGGHDKTHGPKYGIRLRHYTSDTVKTGANITVKNCDFLNIFEDKDLGKDGHAFKIDVDVAAGVVKFEDCTFNGTGYEAIRISDTEKWATDRALDSLIVRNCTFTNIDAEAVRYYSDLDPATPDAPVVLEHITINNSATRVFYLKNSGGAIARDIIIANSRKSGHGRDDDLFDVQGNTGMPSFVSHVDTFMVAPVPLKSDEGEVDSLTVWGIDPKFEDAENVNYTLLPESHLYGLGHDGEALGDLNWATNVPTHVTLSVLVEGEGEVFVDPLPVGLTYDPEQEVTLTAVPDSGYKFVGWTGDLSGSDNPAMLKLDGSRNVTATFEEIDTGIATELPDEYSLSQNYPNPFNPRTTIKFALKAQGHTTIKVFDMLGREVTTLVDKDMAAGRYDIQFHDVTLSSGVYFYTIKSGDFKATRKMILMK
jgi:hypothetical protein